MSLNARKNRARRYEQSRFHSPAITKSETSLRVLSSQIKWNRQEREKQITTKLVEEHEASKTNPQIIIDEEISDLIVKEYALLYYRRSRRENHPSYWFWKILAEEEDEEKIFVLTFLSHDYTTWWSEARFDADDRTNNTNIEQTKPNRACNERTLGWWEPKTNEWIMEHIIEFRN